MVTVDKEYLKPVAQEETVTILALAPTSEEPRLVWDEPGLLDIAIKETRRYLEKRERDYVVKKKKKK